VFSPERVFAFVSRVLEWLLTSLSYSFLLFFVLLYMLLDSVNLQPRLARHLDRDGFARLLRFQHLIRRYWAIQTVTGIVAAALDVALLLALGVPFAVFLGILSFVTNYIPNVGYFIAIIPALFLAAIVKGWVAAVVVFLGYWLFNTIAGSVLAPRLNATHLNLSYTTTMVAVLFWGWVFGPVGGLIAVPLTLFLKDVLLASHAEADWLVDLLSSETPAE
jgi:predicted PurR-regulated permease PerM